MTLIILLLAVLALVLLITAVKLHPFIEIKNRLNCSIVDNAFINMSVLMQATSGRAEQDTALMQIGPLTILPANFEIRQWGIAGRMEEGLVDSLDQGSAGGRIEKRLALKQRQL